MTMENIFSSNQPKTPKIPETAVKSSRKTADGKYIDQNIIDLVDISQEYEDGNVKVFDKLNIEIKDIVNKGQFITIMGASGCGKSTILRYISGLQKPSSGKILFHGKELTETDHIPMVFQQYSSFPWKTVLHNVMLPLNMMGIPEEEAKKRALSMLKVVGLNGHENKWAQYPLLSGGQLQRVAIARNLVANPNVLLMDEPFGALDILTRRQMQVFMRKIFEDNNDLDPTIILVTHDIREAVFLSTNIIILGDSPVRVKNIIDVDLPDVRDMYLKRHPKFLEYVNMIEDIMENLKKS
jgi:NitT/TauT family transport system ATP-binding protein